MTIRTAVLTVSDRCYRGEREDISGKIIADKIQATGWLLVQTGIVPDESNLIQTKLIEWCDAGNIDLILTTGGTGFAPRDITPEATSAVIERITPGLTEAMRLASLKITPHAMLSRASAGIRKRTIIINLPGSPKSVIENLEVVAPVLPHAVSLLRNEPESEKGHSYSAND